MKTIRIELPPTKRRNLAAKAARNQKAGPMKDKRREKGGARNELKLAAEGKE